MYSITVRHNFEAAHRLLNVPGKCHGVHGHSFLADLTVTRSTVDTNGMLLEFGDLKQKYRGWLDEHWDHATLLRTGDELITPLGRAGTKVTVLPHEPTTENLARDLYDVMRAMISTDYDLTVLVRETAVNEAGYAP